MAKRVLAVLALSLGGLALYFAAWPVPVDPVAWQAPPNPGYAGPFAANNRLAGMENLDIGVNHGPESVAVDAQGRIYAGVAEGWIVRLDASGNNPENWVNTGGRPLGLAFAPDGTLIAADANIGLLSIAPDKTLRTLAVEADGVPIAYADDVDVALDGKIYLSDASTKFNPRSVKDPMDASLLDLMEHGGHGRLLVYDPQTGKASTLVDGLNFANGVAVSHDQQSVLVNETGAYRILRHWIAGPNKGKTEPFLENLPAFPDNITRGRAGRYWAALVSPRNPLLDRCADKPFVRKVLQRMPGFLRPKAVYYGHIIAVNEAGRVTLDLQDPQGAYPLNTSACEAGGSLYIGSLTAPSLGRLPLGAGRVRF